MGTLEVNHLKKNGGSFWMMINLTKKTWGTPKPTFKK